MVELLDVALVHFPSSSRPMYSDVVVYALHRISTMKTWQCVDNNTRRFYVTVDCCIENWSQLQVAQLFTHWRIQEWIMSYVLTSLYNYLDGWMNQSGFCPTPFVRDFALSRPSELVNSISTLCTVIITTGIAIVFGRYLFECCVHSLTVRWLNSND